MMTIEQDEDYNYYTLYVFFKSIANKDPITLLFMLRFVYRFKEELCHDILEYIELGKPIKTLFI